MRPLLRIPILWSSNRWISSKVSPVKLSFTRYKESDSQTESLPPLLILHGLFGQKLNWHSVAKQLQTKLENQVITCDLRNHGNSPWATPMTYEEMCGDIKLLAANLGYERVILLGHSLGGKVAAFTTLANNHFVDKLILEDIVPKSYGNNFMTQPLAYMDVMRKIQFDAGMNVAAARKQADIELKSVCEESSVRNFLLTNLAEKDGRIVWKVNLEGIGKGGEIQKFPDYLGNATYSGPTLFICGELSPYMKKEDIPLCKRLFPKAKFQFIEGAGHWIHAEKPYDFIAAVLQFLKT